MGKCFGFERDSGIGIEVSNFWDICAQLLNGLIQFNVKGVFDEAKKTSNNTIRLLKMVLRQ